MLLFNVLEILEATSANLACLTIAVGLSVKLNAMLQRSH